LSQIFPKSDVLCRCLGHFDGHVVKGLVDEGRKVAVYDDSYVERVCCTLGTADWVGNACCQLVSLYGSDRRRVGKVKSILTGSGIEVCNRSLRYSVD